MAQGGLTIYFVVAIFFRLKPVTLVQLGFYAASDRVLTAVALMWGALGVVWLVLGVLAIRGSRLALRGVALVAVANLMFFGATIVNRPTCPWPVQRLWVEGCIAFSHDYPKSLLAYVGAFLVLPIAAMAALLCGYARGRRSAIVEGADPVRTPSTKPTPSDVPHAGEIPPPGLGAAQSD